MDTTAKVDIRRLQLLNDRIAQTIEALNQVRLSVHGLGLSHSSGNSQGWGLGNFGGNVGLQGLQGQGGLPFGLQGQNPGFPGIQQGLPYGYQQGGFPQGIQHSSPYGYQQGIPGFQQGIPGFQQGIPGFQQGIPGYQQGLQGLQGFPQGIQHSSPYGYGNQQGLQGFGLGLQNNNVPYGYPQGLQGLHQGLQHTSPFVQQQQGVAGWPVQNGVWGAPNLAGLGGGLQHTSPDLLELQLQNRQHGIGLDPYTAARILQSFPFAQSAVPGLY